MERQAVVVFVDLIGSTGAFERLGNSRATEAVTRATRWIADDIACHGGRVVKFLGDGVLALFDASRLAIDTMAGLQVDYGVWRKQFAADETMPVRIGVVQGTVEVVDNDCYGDAVNTASRLSELAGSDQIWVNAEAVRDYGPAPDAFFRLLGRIHVRGRQNACVAYQVEWKAETNSDLFTLQAAMDSRFDAKTSLHMGWEIHLSSAEQHASFRAFDMPVLIGRGREAQFLLTDPRVSRNHVRLDWRNGSMLLTDLSTYGTWVRFAGSGGLVRLRREECVLHGQGDFALGAPFDDPSAPLVHFEVV